MCPTPGLLLPVTCPECSCTCSRVFPLPRVRPSQGHHSDPGEGQARLTFPRSRMKQSPLLKLSQDTGTSVARTTRRPLTCRSLCTTTSLGTTCLNPDATPPFCQVKGTVLVQGRRSREADLGVGHRTEGKEILASGRSAKPGLPLLLCLIPRHSLLRFRK